MPSASALAVYSGRLEADLHVALGGEIVDLVGLDLLHQADQVGRVRHVAVMQEERHVAVMRILIEMVDARGVERGRAALDAVHDIALASSRYSAR